MLFKYYFTTVLYGLKIVVLSIPSSVLINIGDKHISLNDPEF